jgi:hypothetical protein
MMMTDYHDTCHGLPADEHHVDCDYRNSWVAKQTAELFGVDIAENYEVFDCNLRCEEEASND